jgi:signal transduction histidine kinase
MEEIHALPSFLALVHPDDRRRVMHNHLRRLRGEVFDNHYDFIFQRSNGERGFGDLTVATLPSGDHLQVVCIIVDITERKLAETRLAEAHREILVKKEEAEKASEGKSRFLAAASHDLRQPLHALTLFATELASIVAKPQDRRLATQIVTAAGAMGELLEAMLDVSRLDIAVLQPQRQPVALGPLLETIADGHRRSALAKGLRLRCRPTESWVNSDPHLLRRMVGNLVANAVRYSYRGGIVIGARPRGDQIRIEVWDSGVGIDDAHLPYLFHEFYQVGNPERDANKGLGLGLAIVSRLGQILDHPIEVRSTPGRGSVFTISLPRIPVGPYPVIESAAGVPYKAKLAVCSTDTAACEAIGTLLASWGYQHECSLGQDDLAALISRRPDLLICDAELLEQAAGYLSAIQDPPLLVIAGDGELHLPPGLTLDGRLARPIRPARLRALLHHLLLEEVEPEERRDTDAADS